MKPIRQTSFPDVTVRHPTVDDAQRTLALMVRCDVSEYGEPDSDLEDLLHEWGQINLNHDAWLAFTPKRDLVGYGAVVPWVSNLRYDFYVDPSWEDEDLGQALLARCEERGFSLAAERKGGVELVAKTYVAHVNQRDRNVVERAGFRPVKHHFNMQVQLDAPLPQPHWPEGIAVRTVAPGQDDRSIYELIQTTFDRPGRTAPTFEEWKTFMMRSDIFETDLWFLAVAAGEIVGACLCFEYPTQGWVRQLGVAEHWRRKGLGTALLRHAFARFKGRGCDTVGLAVAADNADAYAFYQKVGMKRIRQYDEYEKPIGLTREQID